MFFAGAISGREARAFGRGVVEAHNLGDIEIFPKQDELRSGPGSLIRLPFGYHLSTMRRYGFITSAGEKLAPSIREQIALLSSPEVVTERGLEAYLGVAPPDPPLLIMPSSGKGEFAPASAETVSERIKQAVTVLEFVGEYVELKPSGSGARGLCPFHDDHNPSFGVSIEGNFWNCFAGCGGGTAIDFWMQYRNVDFTTAVKELAQMLL